MNILKSLKTYEVSEWSVKEEGVMDAEEASQVLKAEVRVSKDYPDKLCVCFHLVGNLRAFMPLSKDSKLQAGDLVDMSTHKIIVLQKKGENDITRFDGDKIK